MKKVKISLALFMFVCALATFTTTQGTQVIKPCKYNCPDVYDPVCIIATGQQFSNACQAGCAGYNSSQYVKCGGI